MANDINFKLVIQGESKEAAAVADDAVKRLNRLKEATKQLSAERQRIAQLERRTRFNSLTEDQKIIRLKEKQLNLEKQLAKARSSGNDYRSSSLAASLARTRFDLGQLIGAKGARLLNENLNARAKAERDRSRSVLERKQRSDDAYATASEMIGGNISGLGPVGLAIGAITASLAGIAVALKRGFTGAMQFADQMGDTAALLGTSKVEVAHLMKAAGAAGVRGETVMSGLSSLALSRGNALNGDTDLQKLFQSYGISKEMLSGDSSNLEIAQAIVKSLGSGGMLSTDRVPLGTLFGRRPEHTVAAIGAMESASRSDALIESSLDRLDKLNQSLDEFTNKLKIASVVVSALAVKAFDSVWPTIAKGLSQTKTGAIAATLYRWASNQIFPENSSKSSWAEKRRAEENSERTADRNPNGNPTAAPSMAVPNSEAMARIGLYRGGIDPARTDILRAQLETLRAIKYEQVQTVSAIKGEWR